MSVENIKDELDELRERVTIAKERNRANIERRDSLLKEMKDKFGCDTVAKLIVKRTSLKGKIERLYEEIQSKTEELRKLVNGIEEAVGQKE